MSLSVLATLVLAGCEPTVPTVGSPFDGENPTTPSLEQVGGVDDTQPPEPEPEPVVPGEDFYVLDRVHTLELVIGNPSWQALQQDPRSYAVATLVTDQGEHEIGVRLKGGSTYRTLADKPSLKLKFDWSVEDQQIWDLQGINLHNQTYDPSMMAEALSYGAYRSFGVSAPRTAFVSLAINGTSYGFYGAVERKDKQWLKAWHESNDGTLYETGSFNYPCDFNDGGGAGAAACDCWEVDELGTEDTRQDLEDLCQLVTSGGQDWLANLKDSLDFDQFVSAIGADMVLSHWDSYGYNLNNTHLYHDPDTDRWHFSPWSTDLAFGWYPWSAANGCGYLGENPGDYRQGYLVRRCQDHSECRRALEERVLELADELEALDLPARVDEFAELVYEPMSLDPKSWYTVQDFQQQISCLKDWIEARPDQVRAMVDGG